jgi:hypothetical protein
MSLLVSEGNIVSDSANKTKNESEENRCGTNLLIFLSVFFLLAAAVIFVFAFSDSASVTQWILVGWTNHQRKNNYYPPLRRSIERFSLCSDKCIERLWILVASSAIVDITLTPPEDLLSTPDYTWKEIIIDQQENNDAYISPELGVIGIFGCQQPSVEQCDVTRFSVPLLGTKGLFGIKGLKYPTVEKAGMPLLWLKIK